jgi:hypothetical protein
VEQPDFQFAGDSLGGLRFVGRRCSREEHPDSPATLGNPKRDALKLFSQTGGKAQIGPAM